MKKQGFIPAQTKLLNFSLIKTLTFISIFAALFLFNVSSSKAGFDPNLSLNDEFSHLEGNSFRRAYDHMFASQSNITFEQKYANALTARINQYRMDMGREPYGTPRNLQYISRIKLQDMINQGYFAHVNPQGNNFFENMAKIGYSNYTELISRNEGANIEADFNMWKNSYIHNTMMLSNDYNNMGISCAFYNEPRTPHKCVMSIGLQNSNLEFTNSDPSPTASFLTPANDTSSLNFKTDLSLRLKPNNPRFANQDAYVWVVVSNSPDITKKDALYNMDKSQKVHFSGTNDEITVNFEGIYLPYTGENYIYCYVAVPGSNTVPILCGGENANKLLVRYIGDKIPAYRFWSDDEKGHFFTANSGEKKVVENSYETYAWNYEGIGYYVDQFTGEKCANPNASPIYRFWSDLYKAHFYTANPAEKDQIIATNPESTWKFEGVGFCASEKNNTGLNPVFRFWSDEYQRHFFTISAEEKDSIIANNPESRWRFEGIAYYASK